MSGKDLANFLIDAVAALTSARGGEGTWSVANRLMQEIDGRGLVVGAFAEGALMPAWARSSMTSEWRQHYISNGYFEIDPILRGRLEGNLPSEVRPGTLRHRDGVDPRLVEWNHKLAECGYRYVVCRGFADQTGLSQRVIAIASDLDRGTYWARNQAAMVSTLAALVTAYVDPPDENDQAGMVDVRYKILTQREKDVLSLLARGLSTGRIAERLGLAEVTVRKHFTSAKAKMGASSREQALALAMARGQIDL